MENQHKVSLLSSVLFTVCSVIVLDTFVAPSIIGVSSITIWIITAIVFFIPYGLISAELGSTYPDDGGIYSWVKRAFGEKSAIFAGWYYWVNVAFWMPAVFVAFSYWFSYAYYPSAPNLLLAALAILMCWVIVLIGIRGIHVSVMVSTIAAIGKVLVLVLFGGMGVVYAIRYGAANDFSLSSFIPSFDNTMQYIAAIVYNLMGFELIGSIGSKIHKPERTIPLMTVLAGVLITTLYIFGTFGILVAVPKANIDAVDGFYYALFELCKVFGPWAKWVFYFTITVTLLTLVSNMVSWTLGANEVLSAAELDKRSRILSHRHKRYNTPDALYIIMGILSTVLIVLNFALSEDANEIFWTILSFSFVIFLLPYLFMFPAAVRLRRIDASTPRPYRVPGGSWGIKICAGLCEISILLAIIFLFKDADSGFALWTLIIGTLLTTGAGYMLYRSGGENRDVL